MRGAGVVQRPMEQACSCSYTSRVAPTRASWRTAPPRRRAVLVLATPQPYGEDLGWRNDFEQHYVKGKLLGNGAFGRVFLGINIHTANEVAVKVMPKLRGKLTKERTLQKLQKEVSVLTQLAGSRNVIELEGTFETEEDVLLVTEYCGGGDLQKLSDDYGALSERTVALVAHEVLQVVKACHERGIVHGDVKPANFVLKHKHRNPLFSADVTLLGSSWLRAIDFGCSQLVQGKERFQKRTGTPVYMAPEIFDRNYSTEADMWSVGMMLYQMYARRFPFWTTYAACKSAKLDEVQALVLDAEIPFSYGVWNKMSGAGRDFISSCLERDYGSRMTIDEALSHSWLQRYAPPPDAASAAPPTATSRAGGARPRSTPPSTSGLRHISNIVPKLAAGAGAASKEKEAVC